MSRMEKREFVDQAELNPPTRSVDTFLTAHAVRMAAQFLAVGKELSFSKEKTNVNGRAIGARILVTLLSTMQAGGAKSGLEHDVSTAAASSLLQEPPSTTPSNTQTASNA